MERKTAVALGTFDGVHKGHLAVLDLPQNFYRVVVTFNYPPKICLQGTNEIIMSVKDKLNRLKALGIDEVYSMDFKRVKDMQPQDFLEFIRNKYAPSLISCGFNYRFGKNGQGNTELLEKFCAKNKIEFKCSSPIKAEGEIVSSTRIRELLKKGEIESANTLLGVPFSFKAEVIHGDSRGRTLGFPTINQRYPEDLVELKFGVYKTKICVEGKEYFGITNIGIRPTFKIDYPLCETFIKNFTGDLYGKILRITLLEFLREEIKFNSLDELKKQIEQDLKK